MTSERQHARLVLCCQVELCGRVDFFSGHGSNVCEVGGICLSSMEQQHHLQHTSSVEPPRCDVWSANSEDSTPHSLSSPIFEFFALVPSSRSRSMLNCSVTSCDS